MLKATLLLSQTRVKSGNFGYQTNWDSDLVCFIVRVGSHVVSVRIHVRKNGGLLSTPMFLSKSK